MTIPGALNITVANLPDIILLAALSGSGHYWLEPGVADALGLTPDGLDALIQRHEAELLAQGGPFSEPGIPSLYEGRTFNAAHLLVLLLMGDGEVSRALRAVALFSIEATPEVEIGRMLEAAAKTEAATG